LLDPVTYYEQATTEPAMFVDRAGPSENSRTAPLRGPPPHLARPESAGRFKQWLLQGRPKAIEGPYEKEGLYHEHS
jgi:hypothetical protein